MGTDRQAGWQAVSVRRPLKFPLSEILFPASDSTQYAAIVCARRKSAICLQIKWSFFVSTGSSNVTSICMGHFSGVQNALPLATSFSSGRRKKNRAESVIELMMPRLIACKDNTILWRPSKKWAQKTAHRNWKPWNLSSIAIWFWMSKPKWIALKCVHIQTILAGRRAATPPLSMIFNCPYIDWRDTYQNICL